MTDIERQATATEVGSPDLGRWFTDWPRFPALRRLWEEVQSPMRIEEKVDDDHLVIRAELPGIDPEADVDIHVRNHVLHIEAERREEHTEEDEGRYRSEFQYGRFVRTIALPPDADESDVVASYNDGILEVRMPVDKKQAEATRIEITRG